VNVHETRDGSVICSSLSADADGRWALSVSCTWYRQERYNEPRVCLPAVEDRKLCSTLRDCLTQAVLVTLTVLADSEYQLRTAAPRRVTHNAEIEVYFEEVSVCTWYL
jgi:hypothetical protein